MSKKITVAQLTRAFNLAPRTVEIEGMKFLVRGMSEYKRVAIQGSSWKIGQSGGAIPRDKGNLRERHRTRYRGLEGRFGVSDSDVKYAKYVHGGTRKMEARPWLNYAMKRGDNAVRKHYSVFMDEVLKIIAT
ncbi:MAG: hypothetical protein ACTSUF_07710 [Candidatus Heimdallarchaeaceae archaeon]